MSKYLEHHNVTGVDVLHDADGDDVLIGLATGLGDKDWEYYRLSGLRKQTLIGGLTRPAWTLEEDTEDAAVDGTGAVSGDAPKPGPTL
jgi:hypothetical protein